MKNILTFLFLIAAGVSYAASTCETRVDSHQKATTRQRVTYCLTEEDSVAATVSGPELVYSGVYSKEPQPETVQTPTAKNGYFKDAKMSIQHQYVGSQRFPTFKNDTLSEQERAALEQAYLKELEAQRQMTDPESVKKTVTERAPARLTQPTKETATTTSLTQEQQVRGLKARQHKPNRIMKSSVPATPQAEPAQPVVTTTSTEEPGLTHDPLLSSADNEDDLLNEELGITPDETATPIPAPLN